MYFKNVLNIMNVCTSDKFVIFMYIMHVIFICFVHVKYVSRHDVHTRLSTRIMFVRSVHSDIHTMKMGAI